MGKIELQKVRTYSYHGCMDEETLIGSEYEIELFVWADLSKSKFSDKLEDTIDYVLLNKIVVEEMQIPSKLLENVAGRIVERIKCEVGKLKKIRVKVSKISPPINGDVEKVSIVLKEKLL